MSVAPDIFAIGDAASRSTAVACNSRYMTMHMHVHVRGEANVRLIRLRRASFQSEIASWHRATCRELVIRAIHNPPHVLAVLYVASALRTSLELVFLTNHDRFSYRPWNPGSGARTLCSLPVCSFPCGHPHGKKVCVCMCVCV
jgi:hypothetical protein